MAEEGDRGASDMKSVPPQENTLPGGFAPTGSADHPLQVRSFGKTDVGLIREHNEDNLLVADLSNARPVVVGQAVTDTVVGSRGFAAAVCDGMGGAAAGEVASQMAVDTLFEIMRGDDAPADRDEFARRLVTAVEESSFRIYSSAKKDRSRRGMGTTATVAGLIDEMLFVGQVGDSRCYILRGGKLYLITKDQSLVNQLIEAGQLTEAEAEDFEHSNIILQALGTTERVSVDLTFMKLRDGDRVLLCSDGLTGLVSDTVIEEVISSNDPLPQIADRLIELANAGGGHDNITCILADFGGSMLDTAEGAPEPAYQQYPLPAAVDDKRRSQNTRPVIKSVAPRRVDHEGKEIEPDPDHEPRAFSWPSAALVLLLLGLAAAISVGAGRTRSSAALVPDPQAALIKRAFRTVEITIRTNLADAVLQVDGESYGPVAQGEDVLLELAPGEHRFEIMVRGEQRVSRVVPVTGDEPISLALDVEAKPSDADVPPSPG